MDGHELELHLYRRNADWRTDRLAKYVIDGVEHTCTTDKQWTHVMRDWMNDVGIATRATSKKSLEQAALNAGYELVFVEQYQEYDKDYDELVSTPVALGELVEAHLVRRFQLRKREDDATRHDLRYAIIGLAASLISQMSKGDMTKEDMRSIVGGVTSELYVLTQRGKLGRAQQLPSIYQPTPQVDPLIGASNRALSPDDRVSHPKFGGGTVEVVDGDEIRVAFDDGNVRRLHADIAPLEKAANQWP